MRKRGLCGATMFFLLTSTHAVAQKEVPAFAEDERPWALGVSKTAQVRARQLLDAGNELLLDSFFAQAAAVYREALEYWDHPGIHYNLARVQIPLGQPIKAYQSLLKALRYDASALDAAQAMQARNYKKLLESQLVSMEVICDEPQAAVTVDGQALAMKGGKARTVLRPGNHQLVAQKNGYVTVTRSIALKPGTATTVTVMLLPIEDTIILKRHFEPWKTWAVLGIGSLLAGSGGILQWRAQFNIERADDGWMEHCDGGCRDSDQPVLSAQRNRGRLQNRFAIGSFIAGGAVIVAGAAMLLINRPRTKHIDTGRHLNIEISPLASRDSFGLAGSLEW